MTAFGRWAGEAVGSIIKDNYNSERSFRGEETIIFPNLFKSDFHDVRG